MNASRWTQFPMECACYAFLTSYFLVPLFVFGSSLIAALPRKEPDLLTRRIARFGIFIALFLAIGAVSNGLWSCLVFDRLYYSADYFVDFLPFWPITQATIDARFGDEHGKLLGVTLTQLQLVWGLFALGTWSATVILYWFIARSIKRTVTRTRWAGRIVGLVLFPSALALAAGAWNALAPDRLYHYRYGSPPISNFIPPFLHPRHDAVTVGMLRGYFIWPEWSVYVIWSGFIVAGLALPAFIIWRLLRDNREVERDSPLSTKRRLRRAFVVGGTFCLVLALFLVASRKSAAPCAATLVMMDGCKHYWAQVNQKTAYDTPTWEDLRGYFPQEWPYELTQIKRHRRGETERRQKGSLTHGKKTPEIGVNEHEQGTEK